MAKPYANSVPRTGGAPSAEPSFARLGLNPHDNAVRNANKYFIGKRSIPGQEVKTGEHQQGANAHVPCQLLLKDDERNNRGNEDACRADRRGNAGPDTRNAQKVEGAAGHSGQHTRGAKRRCRCKRNAQYVKGRVAFNEHRDKHRDPRGKQRGSPP